MLETMLTLGALYVACRAHYGSDKRWHWYKETPKQYRDRKKRNGAQYSGTNCWAYLASDGRLYSKKETQAEYEQRHRRNRKRK